MCGKNKETQFLYRKQKKGALMKTENLINTQRFFNDGLVTKTQLSEAIEDALAIVDRNIDYFGDKYPTPASKDNVYPKMDNTEWTNGFWPGMLWLAYEFTDDKKYLNAAKHHVEAFKKRIDQNIMVDHHDLGFLYIPSCVSAFKITKNENAYGASVAAAKQLQTRFQKNGGFIQAWGKKGDENNYRLIIDALLNIPLLYWAGAQTGEANYIEMAESHYRNAINTVIREDGSTFHTYFFDKNSGKPLYGATHQGYSDDSSWARGQAWAVYGIPLHYKYIKGGSDIEKFKQVTNYFINRLPEDNVPYWDLIFNDGDDQPRDSSAGAIAVCGMAEMLKSLPEADPDKLAYKYAMHSIMSSLIDNYRQVKAYGGAPLLKHGVYSWHSGKGVDEGNTWGDYFYLEALMRFYKDWQLYW